MLAITVVAALATSAGTGHAQITLINTGSLRDMVDRASYTKAFDAGAADKLIVSVSTESAAAITGITYNGESLTLVPGTAGGRSRGIWYLDDPHTGGTADVVVQGDALFSSLGMGIASIAGTAEGYDVSGKTTANSVTLNVSLDGSFVYANAGANHGVIPTPAAPLIELWRGQLHSAVGAAGYANGVMGGMRTFSFTGSLTQPEVVAVAFGRYVAPGEITLSTLTVSNVTVTSATASAVIGGTNADVTAYWEAGGVPDPSGHAGWDGTNGPVAEGLGPVSRALSGLTEDTLYTYAFYALNGTSGSNAWAASTFATPMTDAKAPVFTNAASVTPGSIALGWQDNAATETAYVLQRSLMAGSGYTNVATLPPDATSYTDTGVAPDTEYFYQLAATNTSNGSGTDFALCRTNALTMAGVAVINSAGSWSSANSTTYTLSFNAGAAHKLILSPHYEADSIAGITYNGVPLTKIPGTSSDRRADGVWYLDDPYTGGAADIVVTMTGTGSQMGLGVVSVAGLEDGYEDVATGGQNISLDVSMDRSFVYVGFGANQATSVTAGGPLTRIAITGDDSMAADAGYELQASSGLHTYSCTAGGGVTAYHSAAAAFMRIPPPPGTVFVIR